MIVVHLTVTPWDVGQTMSRQAMAQALSKYCLNLYYVPPKTISISEIPKKRIQGSKKQINDNLVLLTPPEMQGEILRYKKLKEIQLGRQIKWLKKRIDKYSTSANEKIILYVWHHIFLPFVEQIRHDVLVYHIYDDVFMYKKVNIKKGEVEADKKLISSADIVVVVGKDLAEWKKVKRPWIACPGGVNTNVFKQVPVNLNSLGFTVDAGRKTVGYFGMINSKINLPLLKEIVTKGQDFHFVFAGLIGNMDVQDKALWAEINAAENVSHLGIKKQKELVDLYNMIDMGFMPYRHQSGWSVFAIPLKMSEFLACGKAIVSTPLLPLKEYQKYVQLEENADGFIRAFNDLLKNDSEELIRARIAFAKENSWENRAKLVLSEIKKK